MLLGEYKKIFAGLNWVDNDKVQLFEIFKECCIFESYIISKFRCLKIYDKKLFIFIFALPFKRY